MIVIKGKMPNNCHDCKNGWCQEWERVRDMTKEKSKDCPIVAEIPDEHGELIDKQKTIFEMYNSAFWDTSDLDLAVDIVEHAPAVLEAST